MMVLAIVMNSKQKKFYSVSDPVLGMRRIVTRELFKLKLRIPFHNILKSKFRFNGQVVETVQSTTHQHDRIFHLASYRGQPMTTGSMYSSSSYVKTEIMNVETGQWTTGPDYPFHSA